MAYPNSPHFSQQSKYVHSKKSNFPKLLKNPNFHHYSKNLAQKVPNY